MKESNERVLCGSGWVGRIVCTSLTPPRRRSLNKMAGRRCLERPWLTSCVGSKDVCVGRGEHDGQWLSAPSRGGIWLEGPDPYGETMVCLELGSPGITHGDCTLPRGWWGSRPGLCGGPHTFSWLWLRTWSYSLSGVSSAADVPCFWSREVFCVPFVSWSPLQGGGGGQCEGRRGLESFGWSPPQLGVRRMTRHLDLLLLHRLCGSSICPSPPFHSPKHPSAVVWCGGRELRPP